MLAGFVLLVGLTSCADGSSIPEPSPEPMPEPVPVAPYLEVTPDTLRFDVAGNALNAEGFSVRTNCAWQLDVPEQADWLIASVTSGEGMGIVSFRLFVDTAFHSADFAFSAKSSDGQTVFSQSVTVVQGTAPTESDDPEEKPSEPTKPDDSETDPSNPDTPSVPSTPQIVSVSPVSLRWNATDYKVSKTVEVEVANFESRVLVASIVGPDADRFETPSPVRDGLLVRVTNLGPNETIDGFIASLVISVEGGNRIIVPLSQSGRVATPDNGANNDENGDSDGNNGSGSDGSGNVGGDVDNSDLIGGGCDDFSTLEPRSTYAGCLITSDGWRGENCAVYSGGGQHSDPYYPELLGTDYQTRGMSMNGRKDNAGSIVSPELQGGCGKLTFDYGTTNEGDTDVDFRVEIWQNGSMVETSHVWKTVAPLEKHTHTVDVHASGTFRIVFTNNCPSGQSKDIDRYSMSDGRANRCRNDSEFTQP